MSLHDDFVAAQKNRERSYEVPWELWPVSGALAVFAESIPQRVKTATIRAAAGELLGGPSDPDLAMKLEQGRIWPREFSLETLEKIPGYRRLVEAAADPDNDISFTLSFRGDFNRSSSYVTTIQVTLDPSKPFRDSTVSYEDASAYRYAHVRGSTPRVSFKIGENGPPAWAQKKAKPKLSIPTQG